MSVYERMYEVLLESIVNQLENKYDDIQEGVLIKSPPGLGKSSMVRQIVKNDIAETYDRYIIDLGDPRNNIVIKIDEAWRAIERDIKSAANALKQVEAQYGPEARNLFREEAKIMIVSNTIQNFQELVKSIVIEEGDITLDEYNQLMEKKRELEKLMINNPEEVTDELLEEYAKLVQKLKFSRVKREKPLVFYDVNLASANLVELNGMVVRVLGTIVKLPPWPYVLLKSFGGVINFDEISNIQDNSKITALYKIVLDRKIGETSFIPSDEDALGVAITATGNTMASSTAVSVMPQALVDRFATVVINGLDEEDPYRIGEYFLRKYPHFSITPKFVSVFVNMNISDILNVPESEEFTDDGDKFPTPRSYELTLKALALKNGDVRMNPRMKQYMMEKGIIVPGKLLGNDREVKRIVKNTAAPRIGVEAAERFATKWVLDVPNPQELVQEPEKLAELVKNQAAFMIATTDYLRWLIMKYDGVKIKQHCTSDPNDCKKHIMPIVLASIAAARNKNKELVQLILNWARILKPTFYYDLFRMALTLKRGTPEEKALEREFRDIIRDL